MATIQVVEEHYHKDYFKKLKFKQQQKNYWIKTQTFVETTTNIS